jgi:integrase
MENFRRRAFAFPDPKNQGRAKHQTTSKIAGHIGILPGLARQKSTKIDQESFIFPLLRISPHETDKIKIFNAISAASAFTSKDLRKLSKRAGIDKDVSFHSARHSWAVRALEKGMRIEYVSKLMGHASVKHTEVYAKILNEELDKAMEVFND